MMQKIFITITLISLSCVCVFAQPKTEKDELFSPYCAQTIYGMTDGMYQPASADVRLAKEAMILIEAAVKLGLPRQNVLEDLLRFGVLFPDDEYQDTINWAFKEYLDDRSDLDILRMTVNHGLDQLDSREDREAYLLKMHKAVGDKNRPFASELATQIAMLELEKGDNEAAKTRLIRAYYAYPYNKIAFEKLRDIFAVSDMVLPPTIYADHLRREIVSDPSNLEAVLQFAEYTERLGLYDIACRTYDYAVELFGNVYPKDELPAAIYLPWAVACYNTQYARSKCFEIVADVRKTGKFDILLEGISASLAAKTENASQIKQAELAGQKAEKMLADEISKDSLTAEKLSWFYLFALPNYEKSLAWANRAYSIDAKSDSVKGILSCAFAFNGNYDLASDLVGDLAKSHQSAAIATAVIQKNQGKLEDAVESLKSAVNMDPSSLAGGKAKEMLTELDSEYIADTISQQTEKELQRTFGENVISEYTPIDQLLSIKLGTSDMDFRYGSNISATLSITNKSQQPMIISESSLFTGQIRIDADISGDINHHIEALISERVQPSNPIDPDSSILVPLELMTGQLKDILIRHPQANVKIEFTLYLDPVMNEDGTIGNRVGFIKPIKKSVKRRAADVSQNALTAQLRYLSSGQMKQRIRAIQLFSGLLMEHYQSQNTELSYKRSHVSLPIMTSAVRKGLNDQDWIVRLQTMGAMMPMRHKMEFSFINSISESLYDDGWPSRLVALQLLSVAQGAEFKPVLEWKAKEDAEEIVRKFAQARVDRKFKSHAIPEIQEKQPSDTESKELIDILLEP